MHLNKVTLRNLRGIEQVSLEFKHSEGLYLLVGVNGVGKSTILDAVRISLSKILPKISPSKAGSFSFQVEDLRLDTQSIFADVSVVASNYIAQQIINTETIDTITDNRDAGKGLRSKRKKTQLIDEDERDLMRQQVIESRDVVELFVSRIESEEEKAQRLKKANEERVVSAVLIKPQDDLINLIEESKKAGTYPLAVYYSPHRSIVERNSLPKKGGIAVGEAVAYHEALSNKRTFEILQFAQWWRTWKQEAADTGDSTKLTALTNAFKEVVSVFLPECTDLLLDEEKETLRISKNGKQVDVGWLSDGERSILTLGLDLVRRLFIANPGLSSPREEGKALVLIDELDLHLHPGWQRDVIARLKKCFPKCQFIASTHSPQSIGEVQPDRVLLVYPDAVEHPSQSFGMETGWIIEVLMESDDKNEKVRKLETQIFSLIQQRNYQAAADKLNTLRALIHGTSEEEQRATNLLRQAQALAEK